jgi:hypothetical protein
MAFEDINDDVIENQDEPQTDGSEVEEEVQEEESKESFLQRMKDKWFNSDTQEEEPEVEEDIDEDFISAAKQAGWGEDKIIEFAASYDNGQLRAMAPHLAVQKEEPEDEPEDKDTEEVVGKEAADKVPADLDPEKLDELLKPYVEQIAAKASERQSELESRLEAFMAEKQAEETERAAVVVNDFFDSAAKNFPVFGKTEELPVFPNGTPQAGQPIPYGPAYEARSAVFGMAVKLNNSGLSIEDSLGEALSWYKGKNLHKDVQNKLVRDLKNNESRLSAKRTQKNTARTYANPAEERAQVVLDAARNAGIKF